MSKDNSHKFKKEHGTNDHYRRVYRAIPINHLLKIRGERCPTLNQKLNEELIYSYNMIKLSEEEFKCRKEAFDAFKSVIETTFPNFKVESHGSFRIGTMVFGSDIDITVLTRDRSIIQESSDKAYANQILAKIGAAIENSKIAFGPVLHIKNARVPILKCHDKKYRSKIDIVIDKYDSIDTANFVIDQISKNTSLKYMIVLLKYFLKRRQLSEVIRGGLCSYAQFLLILNFVQLHPLLQTDAIDLKDNIGTIFMDFFQFYGTEFPFERATISVLDKSYKPNRDSPICVEDPMNKGHNVASGCTALHMVKEIFTFSYKIMAAAFAEKVDPKRAIGELWLRLDERELVGRNKKKHKL